MGVSVLISSAKLRFGYGMTGSNVSIPECGRSSSATISLVITISTFNLSMALGIPPNLSSCKQVQKAKTKGLSFAGTFTR